MRRTILLFIIFALLSSSFGQTVTSVVRHVRPEIAVMREIDSIVIKRGVMVANVDDPSDLRIGDGVTRGGHRVGIPWEQSYDFTGKRVIWGDGYTTRGYAGAWLLEQDGVPMASFGRSEYSFAIGAMSITGNTAYASVYWATRPNTNLVVYWATNMADWVDVTTGATLTTIGTRTDIALDITAWSAGAMAVSVPGWTGRYFQVDGRISATSLELGGAAISSWSEIVAGSATDATARAMATAVSGRVDAVEGRLTAVEGAVISNIPPGVVLDTDATYTDTVFKAANAVQGSNGTYTDAVWKAAHAVQPTDGAYTDTAWKAAQAYGWGNWNGRGFMDSNSAAARFATTGQVAAVQTQTFAAIVARGGNLNAGALTGLNALAITNQIPLSVLSAVVPMTIWNSWTPGIESRLSAVEAANVAQLGALPFVVTPLSPTQVSVRAGTVFMWTDSGAYAFATTAVAALSFTQQFAAVYVNSQLQFAPTNGQTTGVVASVTNAAGASSAAAIVDALGKASPSNFIRIVSVVERGAGTNRASISPRFIGDITYDRY